MKSIKEIKNSSMSMDQKRALIAARLDEARSRTDAVLRDPLAGDPLRRSAEDTLFVLELMTQNDSYMKARLAYIQRLNNKLGEIVRRLISYMQSRMSLANEAELRSIAATYRAIEADLLRDATERRLIQ